MDINPKYVILRTPTRTWRAANVTPLTRLVAAAKHNLEANGVTNATVVVAQSQKFCTQLLRFGKWRHSDLTEESIDFSVAVVDPPR